MICSALVMAFYAIHRHYRTLAAQLSLEHFGPPTRVDRHRVILAVSGVHRGTVAGLHYARALSEDVTAVFVSTSPESSAEVQQKWGISEREFLERISPLTNANRIQVPLFVIHGRNDPRVPVSEAERIARTVRDNGVPVWLMIADNEGHGFAKKENADYAFYARVLFLQRHLLGG